ncbi:MAG: PAS domain-containing protein [Spirochaetes bacterium]|nr:PAS domain-containing protein [Spirochaetota bacterium]
MKISFTFFMRAYSFFAILFFILGALALIIGGPALIESYELTDPVIIYGTVIFRIVVIILFGVGFVFSSFIILAKRKRGFASYKRIIDRLSIERSMSFNLNVSFPEKDEFGNLGKWLNKFIEQMREFDKIKVERLRAYQQKLTALSEAAEKGLLVLSNGNKITYANSHFKKLLNIGEKTIVGLPMETVVQNEELINSLESLSDKPKNRVLNDLKVKSNGVVYKTRATVIPIISSEVQLMETMVIFDYIQKKVLPI